MKHKITFILHLPPPIHGASMVGSFIRKSPIINKRFSTRFINLATNTTLQESGKGNIRKGWTFLKIVFQLVRSLSKDKADLYYLTLTASGSAFYKDLFAVMLIKIFGKPIVYHFHNKGVAEASKRKLNHILYKYAFRKTKSILLSSHLYADIQQYVDPKDVYYCALGIEPLKGSVTITTTQGPCRLLFLSNMMAEKGVFILLDALQILLEKNIPFECHFVGAWSDVTEEGFNQYVSRKGLSEFAFAHGPKYNGEKLFFFQHSDIFLFPTYYRNETFGLVNLEAMQHSLPIVATPEGGIPDVVKDGETGFLVPQKDANALAEKIELLACDPSLRIQMGEAGKQRFDNLFTMDKFEHNFTNILADIVREKSK